ncbi:MULTISPECIES: MBL fold metallo-hydrolase [unclassified Paenibacillus]|uniref:MBL fold metallo-hydrolase n=1 Tax=Paenibacillus provencensis TaxID=441151 RepID=A0ABW3PZD7_9BACL|nr:MULTISPECIES: MBL fold metallo-hydrolase [unclassified Paenibacillus]MCM3127610.1 MBL fold metallo-hydrolase [Paenibacillus sp. MER 78]SFS40168.1 phosphoribosyl 1,2-cyclic phosphate phosphodiesterase [Paenibacillus sp. 453mf]
MTTTDKLTFLGTGDAMGVPRLYCDCEVCMEARGTGINRRYRSSVLVHGPEGEFMIDGGPDFAHQMELLGKRQLHTMLVTHPHFDHIGGLPEWADACRWLGEKGELYAPQEVLETIQAQFPWLSRHIRMQPCDSGVELAGYQIRTWKVNHGKNGYSYAYRLEKNGYSWVYCSDSINLNEQERQQLHHLDLLVLGTSFYHELAEFHTRSVYDMMEAQELLRRVKPKQTIFTHMSHDVDVRQKYDLMPDITLARTGMTHILV